MWVGCGWRLGVAMTHAARRINQGMELVVGGCGLWFVDMDKSKFIMLSRVLKK